MIYKNLLNFKYPTRKKTKKQKQKQKKTEVAKEVKTYLNSEILRQPWNILNYVHEIYPLLLKLVFVKKSLHTVVWLAVNCWAKKVRRNM